MRENPIHVGEMTEQASLFHRTLTSDGTGGATMSLGAAYATVWAMPRPLSGREQEGAMRQEGHATFLFVIRNRDDVLETDVVRWSGRDFNIRVIRDRGPRPLYLELECERGVTI